MSHVGKRKGTLERAAMVLPPGILSPPNAPKLPKTRRSCRSGSRSPGVKLSGLGPPQAEGVNCRHRRLRVPLCESQATRTAISMTSPILPLSTARCRPNMTSRPIVRLRQRPTIHRSDAPKPKQVLMTESVKRYTAHEQSLSGGQRA